MSTMELSCSQDPGPIAINLNIIGTIIQANLRPFINYMGE